MRNIKLRIGETIKRRRELLGMLQPQLAAMAGISTRTIQRVEQGKANPSLDTLLQLTDPLGLSINIGLKEMTNE